MFKHYSIHSIGEARWTACCSMFVPVTLALHVIRLLRKAVQTMEDKRARAGCQALSCAAHGNHPSCVKNPDISRWCSPYQPINVGFVFDLYCQVQVMKFIHLWTSFDMSAASLASLRSDQAMGIGEPPGKWFPSGKLAWLCEHGLSSWENPLKIGDCPGLCEMTKWLMALRYPLVN